MWGDWNDSQDDGLPPLPAWMQEEPANGEDAAWPLALPELPQANPAVAAPPPPEPAPQVALPIHFVPRSQPEREQAPKSIVPAWSEVILQAEPVVAGIAPSWVSAPREVPAQPAPPPVEAMDEPEPAEPEPEPVELVVLAEAVAPEPVVAEPIPEPVFVTASAEVLPTPPEASEPQLPPVLPSSPPPPPAPATTRGLADWFRSLRTVTFRSPETPEPAPVPAVLPEAELAPIAPPAPETVAVVENLAEPPASIELPAAVEPGAELMRLTEAVAPEAPEVPVAATLLEFIEQPDSPPEPVFLDWAEPDQEEVPAPVPEPLFLLQTEPRRPSPEPPVPETPPALPAEPLPKADPSAEARVHLEGVIRSLDASLASASTQSAKAAPKKLAELPVLEESRFVVFFLEGARWAVPIEDVLEMGTVPKITPLPNVPGFVRGVTNLRGEVLAVIDMRSVLGFDSPADPARERLLVVKAPGGEAVGGFIVDGVRGLARLAPGAITPPSLPAGERVGRFLRGVSGHDGALLNVLDTQTLFNSPEMMRLAAG